MKKILVIFALGIATHLSYAQQSLNNEHPFRYFYEGKEIFLNHYYVDCYHSLSAFKKVSKVYKLNVESA